MVIKQIITYRSVSKGKDYGIVNEWEDILSDQLKIPLYFDDWKKRVNIVLYKLPFLAECFMQTWKNSFAFMMSPLGNPAGNNKKNIVPCIIDFFLRDESQLIEFYKKFSKNPAVLISSKEAYDFLIEKKCPLKIFHWPLSIPDKYKLTQDSHFIKKYDFVMLGRINPILSSFLNKYLDRHPYCTFVKSCKKDGKFACETKDGEFLCYVDTRDDYMNTLKKCKVAFYGTPGIDGGEKWTGGFNQVTPKFLEYIASGCHVLSRYPKTVETDFYEMDSITQNIVSYEQFEDAVELALKTEVDYDYYEQYLSKHYTSVRAKQLLKMIEEL